MTDVQTEFQEKLVERLSADSTLLAKLGSGDANSIYDNIPDDSSSSQPQFPYIRIGDTDLEPDDAECKEDVVLAGTISVFSRKPGKQEARDIIHHIKSIIHDKVGTSGSDWELSQNALSLLYVSGISVTTEPDGKNTHAVIQYEAMMEEIPA